MSYSILCFDLDGTLVDAKEGIIKSYEHALEGIGYDHSDDLSRLIGTPLPVAMRQFVKSNEDLEAVIDRFRSYYATDGYAIAAVYPGITEMLESLKSADCRMHIVTAKPTIYAKKVLEIFGLSKYFDSVEGISLLDGSADKAFMINNITKSIDTSNERIVMIGDRKNDLLAAKRAEVDSIAIAYGYGSMEELLEAEPTHVVNDVAELSGLLV